MLNSAPFENVEEINFDLEAQFELVEEEKKTPFQYMLDYYNIKVGEVFKIDGEKVYFDENKMLKKENGRSAYLYISLLDETSKVEKLPWKPKYGDKVWMIFSDGGVYECFFSESSPSNISLLKLGWLFPTKEEAESNKERVLQEMKEVLNGTD